MSRQIIKQPNGLYAVWSTVVDGFIWTDGTVGQIVNAFVAEEKERIEKEVRDICKALDDGGKPYAQFTMSWDEANETRKECHGEDA